MFLICSSCRLVVDVSLQGPETQRDVDLLVGSKSEFWPNRYFCVRCGGSVQATKILEPTLDLAGYERRHLTSRELFAGLQGLGFPEERVLTEKQVLTFFTAQCGASSAGLRYEGGHVIVEWISANDGTTLFLGAGPDGAVAYRLRSPFSYVSRFEDNG